MDSLRLLRPRAPLQPAIRSTLSSCFSIPPATSSRPRESPGPAAGAGGTVTLTFTATDANGVFAADPLKISSQAMPLNSTDQLSNQFCTGSAVVPLSPTTYSVDGATN